MAQKRYFEFLSDDATASFNNQYLSLLPAGLYRGFDFLPTNNLFLSLRQDISGFRYPTYDTFVWSPYNGGWRTNQGVIILESDTVQIAQQITPTTSLPRIDLVVGSHQYLNSPTGQFAIYSIIEGTPASSPVPPELNSPLEQVILGYLSLPINCTSLDNPSIVYTKPLIPELGGNNLQVQFINIVNQFSTIQTDFTTIQNRFITFQSNINEFVACKVPQFRFNGNMLQWKYVCDSEWTDLGVPLQVNLIGAGAMEVRIDENQYFPNAEVWVQSTPNVYDENILQFDDLFNVPVDTTFFTLNRVWTAPQTGNYRFVLDTLEIESITTHDHKPIYQDRFEFPFQSLYYRTEQPMYITVQNNSNTEYFFGTSPITANIFFRVRFMKNATTVLFETFAKFLMPDENTAGVQFQLVNLIDEVLAVNAGDQITIQISIQPNWNVAAERITINFIQWLSSSTPSSPIQDQAWAWTGNANDPSSEKLLHIYANTAWLFRNNYEITSGHWLVIPQ